MATSLAALSASVTRILSLTGFSKELKTKDIQAAFADWEGLNGGFKIKWRDDTSLLIVFQDASVAKRAYLHTLAFPPPILTTPSGITASIKPYDGPDAQSVIQNVNARGQHNANNPSRQSNRSNSVSVFPTVRAASTSFSSAPNNIRPTNSTSQHVSVPDLPENGREPSPTLPNLPSHPTLNSLISSSLGEAVTNPSPPSDPAILATSLNADVNVLTGGPRIGDPGKRMLGAALGVRHPSLTPRAVNGNGSPSSSPAQGGGVDQAMREVQRAMGGLVVAE
jgi:hypothetical protein